MRHIASAEKLNLFSPEIIESMGTAFDGAWRSLADAGSAAAAPFRAKQTREALALFILNKVSDEAYDVRRLSTDTAAHVLHHLQPLDINAAKRAS